MSQFGGDWCLILWAGGPLAQDILPSYGNTHPEVELPPVSEAPVTLLAAAHSLPPGQEVVVAGGLWERDNKWLGHRVGHNNLDLSDNLDLS